MLAELVKTENGIRLQVSPESEIEQVALDLFESEYYDKDTTSHYGIEILDEIVG